MGAGPILRPMQPYLAKACRRAAIRLGAGSAALIAIVGLRIVTATPRGIEGEIAELERFEARGGAEAAPSPDAGDGAGSGRMDGGEAPAAAPTAVDSPRGTAADPDRLVRCRLGAQIQFMRAADCETRGGRVEERPAPSPEPAGPVAAGR